MHGRRAELARRGPEARFRYPLDPLIAVLAFGGLVWLASRVWYEVWRRQAATER